MLFRTTIVFIAASTTALPVSHRALSNTTIEAPLAHVGALTLPYDSSCSQGEGFYFSAGGTSCMASPFKPVPHCSDTTSPTSACLRNGPGGSSFMKYMKVDDESSSSEMQSVTAEAEGGGYGVKVSASVSAQKSSKMSSRSTSYVLYGHKHLGNLEVANAHMLELTTEAKALVKKGFEAFTRTYGTHLVGYISSGATFYGAFTIYSTSSSSDDKLSVAASVEGSYGPFSAKASSNFESARSTASSSTKVEGTLRCTGTVECASEPPATAQKMLDMSKTWHSATEKMGTPLKMAIYPYARSADLANTLNGLSNDDGWSQDQKDALFGFGLPTPEMLAEWKAQQNAAQLFLKSIDTAMTTWDGMDTDNVIERARYRRALVAGKDWTGVGVLPSDKTKKLSDGSVDDGCAALAEHLAFTPRDVPKFWLDRCVALKEVTGDEVSKVYIEGAKCTIKPSPFGNPSGACYFRSNDKNDCEAQSVCQWNDAPGFFIPSESMVAEPSSGRELGSHPVHCTCANGREYHVGDYSGLSTCEKDRGDWDHAWWNMGGAAACRGGLIRWAADADQICDASEGKATVVDASMPMSKATVGATCSVPEVQLQLQELLVETEQYNAKFLDTSLEHVMAVQKNWQTQPAQVFFWHGATLQTLKQKLEAIAQFMDSSLLVLDGVKEENCQTTAADGNQKKAELRPVAVSTISNKALDSPQACAVAVLQAHAADPMECSDQYMAWQSSENGQEAQCHCLPPTTQCKRETTTSRRLAERETHFHRMLGTVEKQDHYIFKINQNVPSY